MEAARLRTATETEHRTLEAELDLLSPSLTRQDYAELLASFYVLYSSWEKEAERLIEAAVPGLFGPRRKAIWLEADLAALNYPLEDLSRRAQGMSLPALNNTARAFGSMYVIEGSTLGGQILSRHFRKQFGLEPGSGGTFFSGYGPRTSEMWREFREVLARRPASEDEDMVDSALMTFKAFRRLTGRRSCR